MGCVPCVWLTCLFGGGVRSKQTAIEVAHVLAERRLDDNAMAQSRAKVRSERGATVQKDKENLQKRRNKRQRKARNQFNVDEHLAKAVITPAGKASTRAAASK